VYSDPLLQSSYLYHKQIILLTMASRTLPPPYGSETTNVAAMNDMEFISSLDDLVQGTAVSQAGRATNRWQGSSLANLDSLTASGASSNPTSQLSNDHSSLMMMDMPSHGSTSEENNPTLNLASMIASASASVAQLPAGGPFGTVSSNTTTAAMPQAASSSSLSRCLPPPPPRPTSAKLAPSLDQSSEVSAGKKRARESTEISENEDEGTRRRQDRNVREQQRSQQITGQISGLKQVLEEANIQFKPDKHSTLVSVVDYVKQLQERSRMLEGEHTKLQDTITRTTEIVNSQNIASSADPSVPLSNDLLSDGNTSPFEEDSMVLVKGLDYRAVFGSCPLACSIASVDGRFLDCNKEFEEVTGYNRQELFPSEVESNESESDLSVSECGEKEKETNVKASKNQSFFNILNQDDMREVFGAMSDMLRRSVVSGSKAPEICQEDCWSGCVRIGRFEQKMVRLLLEGMNLNEVRFTKHCTNMSSFYLSPLQIKLTISLVRTDEARPRFFNCNLLPVPVE
jgi:PAS domain S-box-containing protein